MKDVHDLYIKNYEIFLREILKYLYKWKHESCSCIRSFSVIKMSILPIFMQILCIPNTITADCLNWQTDPKIYMLKYKEPRKSQKNFEEELN